jgi:hypothetical protein
VSKEQVTVAMNVVTYPVYGQFEDSSSVGRRGRISDGGVKIGGLIYGCARQAKGYERLSDSAASSLQPTGHNNTNPIQLPP